jgi:hypothetical protein
MMRHRHALHLAIVATALHLLTGHASEPFFNNDETRHTMTGVFVRDALADFPESFRHPKAYAEIYYLQYPALGLLVWPPFFYGVEGIAMALFGPSFAVGRAIVAAFELLMLVYGYGFARLTEDHLGGLFVAGFTALSPIIFVLSQRVMLEVPTLALGLVSIVHFEKYLRDRRGRDALLAGLFAAFCALTRFDGVVLLPYFAIRIVATRNWGSLLTRPVIATIALAFMLTVPYYALTFFEYRAGLSAGASDGFTNEPRGPLEVRNWIFYPRALPELIGWFGAILAIAGLLIAILMRRASGPALALLAANYLMFSPLAELDARHILYWVPALAVFAWRGIELVRQRSRWMAIAVAAILLPGMVWETSTQPFRYVLGYDDAAAYVVQRNTGERPLFVEGELTGSFVYHVRLHDPERRQTVLRGDKILYSMLSDPSVNYRQHALTEADVVAVLHEFDPEWIVVEDPPPTFHDVPGSALLRATLKNHPESYRFEASIPIRSNYDRFDGCALAIYRKLDRNPTPAKPRAVRVPGLGRTVGK